jgi:hypothetical protein
MKMRCMSFAAAVAAVVSTAAPAAARPTITVSSGPELAALLPQLTQATLVLLAPGEYGNLSLRYINPLAEVTVRSADPSQPAMIRQLQVRDSSKLRFDAIRFFRVRGADEGPSATTVMVRDSESISFTRGWFHGTLNNDANDDGYLLRVQNSDAVVVLDSKFEEGRLGVLSEWNRDLLIASSTFRQLREGVNFAGGTRLRVERSRFTEIYANDGAGDHADCIQVYQRRDGSGASDVQIMNNVMIPVGLTTQGLFVRNSLDPLQPHRNIRVVNNVYFGSMRNGIALSNVDGALISGNTVMSAQRVTWEPGVLMRSVTNGRLERTMQPVLTVDSGVTQHAVLPLRWSRQLNAADPQAQVKGSLQQTVPDVTDFAVVAGSQAAGMQAGFTPVAEVGGVPDALLETRYTWYRVNLQALTDPNARARTASPTGGV